MFTIKTLKNTKVLDIMNLTPMQALLKLQEFKTKMIANQILKWLSTIYWKVVPCII
jgi:hypothetical protein